MEIEAYEAKVADADKPSTLWAAFTEYFHDTEIFRAVYHHLPPFGAPDADAIEVSAYGVPADLVAQYVGEKLYRDNPALQHALRSVAPFYFDELGSQKGLSVREAAFLETMRALDLARGLGIPVYGPNGRNGYCGLGLRVGTTRLDPGRVFDFQWVCQLAHLRYCSLLQPRLSPTQALSGRESEVLAWVARGKSNASIGEILGISAHTVDAHLRRIYLKLGVFDRITAALRGIGIGLIHAEG